MRKRREKKKRKREQKFYGTPFAHWAEDNVLVRNADSVESKTHLTQGDFKRQTYRDGQSIQSKCKLTATDSISFDLGI